MASEKAIDARIQKLVASRGGWSVKFHGTAKTRAGVPDRLVCYRGVFIAVEVKKPGGKPTRIQQFEIDQIKEAGGIAIVATDTDIVGLVLDYVDYLQTFPRKARSDDGEPASWDDYLQLMSGLPSDGEG